MNRRRRLLALILATALLTAACGDDTDGESTADGETDDPDATASDVEVTAEVTVSPHSPIAAAIDISAGRAVKVAITAAADDHTVEVPITAAASTSVTVPVVGMRQDRTYSLEIRVLDEANQVLTTLDDEFVTGTIDYPLPDFEVAVDETRAQPGITLVELNPENIPEEFGAGQPVVGIDHEGEVIWWYRNSGNNGAVRPTPRGTLMSQFWPLGVREVDLLGSVTENWHVVPEPADDAVEVRDADALAAIDELFGGNEGDPDSLPVKADWVDLTSVHHEAYPMPGGTILALSTTNHELTPEQQASFCPDDDTEFAATSDVIVEFERDGTVVRTWDLWDVIDIEEIPGPQMCATDVNPFMSIDFRDWTHANAVVYDADRDAILISSRHTDQVIALDHLDDTGPQSSVRWILGRNPTISLDGDVSYHPHAVELQDDGSILLYDNGNFRPGTDPEDPANPPYSRAVHYAIDDTSDDPADWTATQLWEHRIDDDVVGGPLYAFFLGDADRMDNGNVLVNHGGIGPRDGFNHVRIIEVVPDGADGGDIVWDLSLGTEEFPMTVYRAERLPSLYFGPDWES